jgi:hypothetical protein
LWTVEVTSGNREFNCKNFLEAHHRFNRVEAVHPIEAHRQILTPA